MVYGDTVIQGNDAFAGHNLRTSSTLSIHDLPTISMPHDDTWAVGGFDELERIELARPYYHTANFLRLGHDIFYSSHPCRTGNARGLDWIKDKIKDINHKARFHQVDAEEHLDGYIMFVRPGLLLSTKPKDRLPDYFSSWDVITVDESDKDRAYKKTLAYRWKKLNPIVASEYAWFMQANPQETWFSINGLSIDERTIIFPGVHPYLFSKLESLGIECLTVSMRALSFWDSGLHCCTSELARSGDLEDYS
jgi:N-dimethylarginine dimethylaminohydrolase